MDNKEEYEECILITELFAVTKTLICLKNRKQVSRNDRIVLTTILSLLTGMSCCYCSDCKKIAAEYWQLKLNQEIRKLVTV